MKKRVYLFLLLLPAVLIFSGCGKKVDNNKVSPVAGNPAAQTNVAAENGKPENTKMSASAKEMLKSGKSLECTFSFTDAKQGTTQSGKFYVDGPGARFRSETEVAMKDSGKTIKSYMITDGDYGYSWSDMTPATGFKINLNENATTGNTDKSVQNSEDLDQKIDFDCRKWSVDKSKFDLPAGVKFTDFDQMMKSLSVPASPANVDVCSICNQIPDAATKAECKKANCK
jgi:hypothetical protein